MNHQYSPKVVVIVDVFRAFSTAAYLLERHPKRYFYATKSSALRQLRSQGELELWVGKNEVGEKMHYHIPNSPTRVTEVEVKNRIIMHRSEAGSTGILSSTGADIVLAAAFVNAQATVQYLGTLLEPKVTIMPMGHEGIQPSIEDDLCAHYLQCLLSGRSFDLDPWMAELKKGPGQYFFGNDQWQYPEEDFKRCLELNRVEFAIQAQLYGDHAVLLRCQ